MGLPIALRLTAAGHRVTGDDAAASALARWPQAMRASTASGNADTPAASPASANPDSSLPCAVPSTRQRAAASPEVVIVCVSDEMAARAVIEAHSGRWTTGVLVIDHTTTSAAWAREAHAQLADRGVVYCDAPLSGGVHSAERGELVAMLGADADALEAVRDILAAYTSDVLHLGGPGAGQICKMVNQIAIAGIAAGLEAARELALTHGLALPQVFAALSLGSAHSVQLERLREQLSDIRTAPRSLFGWLGTDFDLYESATPIDEPTANALIALYRQHVVPLAGTRPVST